MPKFGIELETLILDSLKEPKLLPVYIDLVKTLDNNKLLDYVKKDVESITKDLTNLVEGCIITELEYKQLRKLRRRLLGLYIMSKNTSGFNTPSQSTITTELQNGNSFENGNVKPKPKPNSKPVNAENANSNSEANSSKVKKGGSASFDTSSTKFAFMDSYTKNTVFDCVDPTNRLKGYIVQNEGMWVVDDDSSVEFDIGDTDEKCYTVLQKKLNVHDMLNDNYTLVDNMEVVSPPFKLEDGPISIKGINDVFKIMNGIGTPLVFFHNETTSQHIHYSFPELANSHNVLKLCLAWWWFEPVIMSLVSQLRRNNSMYCAPLRKITHSKCGADNPVADAAMFSDPNLVFYALTRTTDPVGIMEGMSKPTVLESILAMFQGDESGKVSRYCALNLLNLPGKLGTVEVRIKHGSNDVDELYAFVRFFYEFIQQALERPVTYFSERSALLQSLYAADYYNNKSAFQIAKNALYEFLNIVPTSDEATWIEKQIALCNPTKVKELMQIDNAQVAGRRKAKKKSAMKK